jgi:hypothetical protein
MTPIVLAYYAWKHFQWALLAKRRFRLARKYPGISLLQFQMATKNRGDVRSTGRAKVAQAATCAALWISTA